MFDVQRFIEAAPLGDKRRNERAVEIVTGLIQGGETAAADHVHATGEAKVWAHTSSSLRFYSNPSLLLPNLHELCRVALAELVPRGSRAYVIYDISPVDYSHHEAKLDRIRIGNAYGTGDELFSALVLDQQERPLGPVMQELHTARGCLSSEASMPFPFVDHYQEIRHPRLPPWPQRFAAHGRPSALRYAVRAACRYLLGTVEQNDKKYEMRVAKTLVMFHGRSWRGAKHGRRRRRASRWPYES